MRQDRRAPLQQFQHRHIGQPRTAPAAWENVIVSFDARKTLEDVYCALRKRDAVQFLAKFRSCATPWDIPDPLIEVDLGPASASYAPVRAQVRIVNSKALAEMLFNPRSSAINAGTSPKGMAAW